MNKSCTSENEVERQRLLALTATLTEEDLTRPLPNGWSVASTLAHLAFWDCFCLSLIEGWERDGFTAPSHTNVEAVNAAVRRVSDVIPNPAVILLVREAADAVDRKVERLSPQLATAIEASGSQRILNRAMHRREHLDQLEKALCGSGDGA